MSHRTMLVGCAVAIALTLFWTPSADAQCSALGCLECDETESGGFGSGTRLIEGCSIAGCTYCTEPAALSEDTVAGSELLSAISMAPMERLRQVVEEHGHRLLLYAPRNLLAVQGNASCEERSVEAVIFLSEERTLALERLDLRSLDEFLSARTASDGK